MARIEPDWSRIYEDLLFSIVKLLPARIDILRLRAVCRSFRATIPPPTIQYPFPHSILTNTDFLKGPNPKKNDVLNLTASTVYAIEPLNKISNTQDEDTPQTWLLNIYESNLGTVEVIDPMASVDWELFTEEIPESLNLLDYRVKEIGKFYYLVSAAEFSCFEVVFSSFLDEHDEEFAVMARCNGRMGLGLEMWRSVDQKWSHIDIGLLSNEHFKDYIYYNGKFYALLSKGRTVTVDPKSLIVTQVAADLRFNRIFPLLSLVGSFDDLFLVGHYGDVENNYFIKVFKLNEKKRKWVRVVDGLDLVDRVLFVCDSFSFSVSVKEFPGFKFKGGCVYSSLDSLGESNPGTATWIWDFDDGKLRHILDCPGYLNFIWPPPPWLKPLLKANAGEEKPRFPRRVTGLRFW